MGTGIAGDPEYLGYASLGKWWRPTLLGILDIQAKLCYASLG